MADPISIGLAIGSVAMSAVGAFAQMSMAKSNAEAEYAAAQRTLEAQYEEADRQAVEARETTQSNISDRVRKANMELGAVRAAAMDRGLSGSSINRVVASIAYAEGADISRMKSNYEDTTASLAAQKKTGQVDFTNRTVTARNRAKSSIVNAAVGFGQTALSIGGTAYNNKMRTDAAQNTT